MRPILSIVALLIAGSAGMREVSAQEASVTVVTSLEATYSIAATLAEGTEIEVVNLPGTPAPMGSLARALERAADSAAPVYARADAVITIRSIWPADPLFAAARASNVRIVEIDAARPFAGDVAGVALLPQPGDDAPWRDAKPVSSGFSPYIWLSLSNGQRMAELIADDLERLSPEDATRIARNLETFKTGLRALKSRADERLLALDTVEVYALTDRFEYLLADLGIFVTGHFLQQDALWTAEDHAGVKERLSAGPRIVLHHWDPDQDVAATVNSTGASLLVLESGDPADAMSPDSYRNRLAADIDALITALAKLN